jgi:penicillin-binding protein-related factor A (putative recombinase)|tara:strand:- start:946 stop:1635 length:690 start_codon:yes stop_codon:yes gene_type:complete
MNNYFRKISDTQIDRGRVTEIIDENLSNFFCPFSNVDSYLNIYQGKRFDCDVKFFNMQECDYSLEPNRDGKKYIRYLMNLEKTLGNTELYLHLKENYEKFIVEINEENFIINRLENNVKSLLEELELIFESKICRARIVKLPAGGKQPYHRDETADNNMRVVCPIITSPEVMNAFKNEDDEEELFYIPATGDFYVFDDTTAAHAVYNNSAIDRYTLIFTVINRNASRNY